MPPKFSLQKQRQSIRIKGYDYTYPGAYFITIVRAFKAAVTRNIGRELNELRRSKLRGKTLIDSKGIWQHNYYEHIIRDEHEWNNIHLYIKANRQLDRR
jgi:REP element-mobilizing transposase RayT